MQLAGAVFRYAVATARLKSDPTRDLRGARMTPTVTRYAAVTEGEEVGETVRLAAGVSRQVTLTRTLVAPRGPAAVSPKAAGSHGAVVTASNCNAFPVTLDVPIGAAGQAIEADGQEVGRTGGIYTWPPPLTPGGKAELRYRY